MQYRRDIDGLRAVAVLPVVAFHAGFNQLPGGFVGVDVFFVISGYLITANIFAELSRGDFSLLRFYERRVRRIAPALLAVLAATTALAYFTLLPGEMLEYARSLIASVFSASNVFFWTQAGYFDSDSSTKLLLHTWSLSVEEQFYIVFPLLLSFVLRVFPTRLKPIIWVLMAVSFASAVASVALAPSAAFYLPHNRAWELMVGSVLALGMVPKIRAAWLRETAALSGLAMIGAAVLFYREQMPFPGAAAILPCLGAGLVIAAGETGPTLMGRLLSWRPVVFIGLISYSLYLWHWPVMVGAQMNSFLFGGAPAMAIKIGTVLVSIVLATISWWFIERPFRNGPLKLAQKPLFQLAGVAAAALVAVGVAGQFDQGLAYRYSPRVQQIADLLTDKSHRQMREGSCFLPSGSTVDDFDMACVKQDPQRRDYLLIGDSHAAHLWYGLAKAMPTVNVMQATASGCKPTLTHPGSAEERCVALMDRMFDDYLPAHKVDTVVLAARWKRDDLPRLEATLTRLRAQGLDVIVFGPIIEYRSPLPRLLAVSDRMHDPDFVDEQRVDVSAVDRAVGKLARQKGVRYVSLASAMCPGGHCLEVDGKGYPVQFDYGHLTGSGSEILARRVVASHPTLSKGPIAAAPVPPSEAAGA